MLILQRDASQVDTAERKIVIEVPPSGHSQQIEINLLEASGGSARLGFTAPRTIRIWRKNARRKL